MHPLALACAQYARNFHDATAPYGALFRLDWDDSAATKEQGKTPEGGVTIPSKGGWMLPLPVAVTVPDLDAPPTEQACVDGPGAWPKQRQRGSEGSEQQLEPELFGIRERAPGGDDRGERADDRRPETYEQKNTDGGSDYVEHGDCGGRSGSPRGTARSINAPLAAIRMSRSPAPGAPWANVENSLRTPSSLGATRRQWKA
jgi:hypothetical protein